MTASKQAWFVGTGDGLFRVERDKDGAFRAHASGLRGAGGFRAAVVVDHADPRRLYAGTTRGGMFRSTDGGENWHAINDGILYKDIWSIVQDPNTGTLYAGTSPAGVFRSTNGGDSWTACDSLWQLRSTKQWHGPIPPHISRLKDLTLGADGRTLFGAIEEGWALRSPDGGESWEQLDQGVPHDAHSIRPVPGSPDTLVLGGNQGMFRSTDGGSSWAAASEGLNGRAYTPAPIVTRESRPGVLFSCVAAVGPAQWRREEGGDCAFCRSDDGGQTWQTFTGGLPGPLVPVPRALAADPTNELGYLAGMTDGSVWASQDDGGYFAEVLRGLPAVMSIAPASVS
jgi:photosystem II stability/assembly factor-like uncharacterized protein